MNRLLRDFRIIPVVLVATTALFVLKSTGLIFNGGYTLASTDDGDITGTVPQRPAATPKGATATDAVPLPSRDSKQRSWAQQMFNFPDATGSVPEPKPEQKGDPKAKAKPAPKEPPPTPAGTVVPLDGGRILSAAERAVLERLSERRNELDARAKELEAREAVVLAAEKRLESRVAHLKQLEAKINEIVRAKDENETARVKNLVTMYENMKPKDAARVFDRLDLRILLDVATQINPRRMSDIMAQMSPEAAERLTVELASRAKDKPPAELPKINGQPTTN
ncbi:MAG: flagellar protein FlbB [Xanthobacteraceae bacterium]|nr:flagellar protein FlbB [Xanthobacteraceae bacterium]